MCWAVPAKVTAVDGMIAKVDFGSGTVREVLAAAPEELFAGDFVLVHAGAVISKLNVEEFMESFGYYREIAVQMAIDSGIPKKQAEREVDSSLRGLLGPIIKG